MDKDRSPLENVLDTIRTTINTTVIPVFNECVNTVKEKFCEFEKTHIESFMNSFVTKEKDSAEKDFEQKDLTEKDFRDKNQEDDFAEDQ